MGGLTGGDASARPPGDAVLPLARRRAYAYLSRVIEPGSPAVAAWLAALDVEEAALAVRQRQAPEAVLAASAARHGRADPDLDLAAAETVGARLVTPECAEWPYFALACVYALDRRRVTAVVPKGPGRGGDSGPAAAGADQDGPADHDGPADVDGRPGRDGDADGDDEPVGDQVPPIALWVRGADRLTEAAVRGVAVVGARASTAYGDHVAGDLARGLAERDVTVVSGGAFGIDAAAHRGALAAGGRTWLVSAGGVDRPYPGRHAVLYDRVIAEGLVVSEYPPGTAPLRHRFIQRNRLIAALSCATVVVEAARRSGALNTARHARQLDRPVLAVPGPVTSATSAGCHDLLRGRLERPGRQATLVTGVGDVMAFVDGSAPASTREDPGVRLADLDALTPIGRRVFDGLPRRGWVGESEIAGRCGLSPRDVARSLPALRLAGLVEVGPGGFRVAHGVLR